jgi:Protein of unknown function (DUF3175)
MGGKSENGFNAPATGPVHQERGYARALASKEVSPKGPQSGMRMLNYFINRAGRGLTRTRRAELEKAKSLLSRQIRREKGGAHAT